MKQRKVSILNGLWIADREFNTRVMLVLMAAMLLLAFSPFGFIVFPTVSITTLYICVMVAALWGGPIAGAGVGLMFGLCSMCQATVTAVSPIDLLFAPTRSGAPMQSIILAIAPRMLFGIVAGLLYFAVMKWLPKKGRPIGIAVASIILDRVQSALTYLFIGTVFHIDGITAAKSLEELFSSRRLQNYTFVVVILLVAYLIYEKGLSKKYYEDFCEIREKIASKHLKYVVMMLVAFVVIYLTAAHFWEGMQTVMFEIDKAPKDQVSVDLILQLMLQFSAGVLGVVYVVIVFYKHVRNSDEIARAKVLVELEKEKERANELKMRTLKDVLTGVYNRKGLEHIVDEEGLADKPVGFLLIDIDHFKEINDTYGHEIGDAILTEIGRRLIEYFGITRAFRLGGDEFAVLIVGDEPWEEERLRFEWSEVKRKYELMREYLKEVLGDELFVSWSVGGCYSNEGFNENLYPLADLALYETKNNGRAGCTVVDPRGEVQTRWKDPKADLAANRTMKIRNTGVCRFEVPLEGDGALKLFCDEDTRNLFGLSEDVGPEECARIWQDGILPEYRKGLDAARRVLEKDGHSAYSYAWHHPIRGNVHIRSGCTGEIKDGIMYVLAYYQILN